MPVHPPSKAAPRPQGQKRERLHSIINPQSRPFRHQAPSARPQRSERISICPSPACLSNNLVDDNGELVCQDCGTLVAEVNIVSDNTFIETGGGESMRAGVTVGNDASRARVFDPVGARVAGGMTSREVSEANGRYAIRAVAGHPLNIVQDLQDAAMQVYKLALANNFVQGRQAKNVAAVCLYIACRKSRENNKWMLIDFADKCGVNVFKLGMTFKALLAALQLTPNSFKTLEPINIEGLILRFAEQMGFGRAKQRIANEAVRIVQRMERDWMTHGRRPAGICGAALILAARMNNFRRVVREVVYIVKVAEVTVFKRLDEFKATESSGLTVEQFRDVDLPGEADPPAFANKVKAKRNKKDKRKRGRKSKAPIDIADDSETEAESEAAGSAASPSRQKRGRKRKAPILVEDDDSTEVESESAGSATPSNTNEQLQTPANTQAQRDRRSMPPPPVPIDPALLKVSAQRLFELRRNSASPPARSTRSRGRPPGKTKPPPEPSASELRDDDELETEMRKIIDNQTNVENARRAHRDPNAPGILLDQHATLAPITPPSTQSGSTATVAAQQSSSTGTDGRTETSAPSEAPAAACSISRCRNSSLSQSPQHPRSGGSPSNSLQSGHSPSRSPSPPPKRRRTIRPIELITSDLTTQTLLDRIPSSEIIPEDEFATDVDVVNCKLTDEESVIKERLWVSANSDYLRAIQAKFLKQQYAEQNGTARKIVPRKRKRTRIGDLSGVYDERGPPKDAAEAVTRMMNKRAFSKKINYDRIGDAYGGSRRGSDATSVGGSPVQSGSQSLTPTTRLDEDGEIVVESPGVKVQEVGRIGDSREEPMEVEDEGESDSEDYFSSEDEDKVDEEADEDDEMAGVPEVLDDMEV
ncbi:MAG: hypothetical protein Q9166_002255 [cf. Caloplaca sp. 2 TL-2023]